MRITPALLTVDLQRYYLEVGHEDKLARVSTLIANTNDLIDWFHRHALPIVRIQLVHKADGSTWNQQMKPHWTGEVLQGTLTEGTWEAEPHPDLDEYESDIVVTKSRGSAFLRTDLEGTLRSLGVDTVVVAGFSIDRCVGLTALDAWERDFKVILAGDAILGTNPANGQLMLDYLKKAFAIEPVSNAEVKRIVDDGLATVYNGTTGHCA
jgi:nicotinamidase-related amidase